MKSWEGTFCRIDYMGSWNHFLIQKSTPSIIYDIPHAFHLEFATKW